MKQTIYALIKILMKWIWKVLITIKENFGKKFYIHSNSCFKARGRRPCIEIQMDKKGSSKIK